jgi:CheY-like chemotaxis protein
VPSSMEVDVVSPNRPSRVSGGRSAVGRLLVVFGANGVDEVEDRIIEPLVAVGYRVACASSVAEAVAKMREERPVLVLLDLDTPALDGAALRRLQLEDPAIDRIPVIAFVNEASTDLDEGVATFARMLDPPDLIRVVSAFCRVEPKVRAGSAD